MKLSQNLLQEVRRAANGKKSEITIEEILDSPQFRAYVQRTAASLTGRYGRDAIHICAMDLGPNAFAAFTNGNMITLNTGTAVAARYESMLSRFVATMGLVFHECAHCRFCDFDADRRALEHIRKGMLYGGAPEAKTPEEAAARDELLDAVSRPEYAPVFTHLYNELSNYTADAHDEAKMTEQFGDYIEHGLTLCAESIRTTVPPLEKMEREGLPPLGIFFNLVLQMMRFGDVLTESESTLTSSPYMEMVGRAAGSIYAARVTDDPWKKYTAINQILLAVWPLIRDLLKDRKPEMSRKQAGNGSSDPSGNTDGSPSQPPPEPSAPPDPEQIRRVLEALRQGGQQAGGTTAPENVKTSQEAREAAKAAKKGTGGTCSENAERKAAGSPSEQPGSLAQLISEIARDKAEAQIEGRLTRRLTADIRSVDQNTAHKDISLRITRIQDVTESDITLYEQEMADIRTYARRTAKAVEEALRDQKTGFTAHHRLSGSRLAAGETYRPDQRFWDDRKAPQDLPEMAVAVLVDLSGSMNGERIEYSRRAAMLLHDFCTRLDIPVQVSGHRTQGAEVEFIVYTDYMSIGKKDRYRLAQMSAGGSNRDGMALEIAASMLSKRPEEVKLLFIISDGRPNHHGYRGEAAAKDIQEIVRRYRKKGVEIIACAIGEDRELIRSIYGDGYLDVEDLAAFPKSLVKLVLKRMI